MSGNDNNLLTFLKKQSLFSNSPSKNISRKRSSRSRSKDRSNDIRPATNSPQDNNFPSRNLFNPPQETNSYQRDYSPIQAAKITVAPNEGRFGSFEDYEPRRDLRAPEPRPVEQPRQPQSVRGVQPRGGKQGEDRNNMWTGLVSYSTSFQSARVESVQCLDNLSNKLRNEITGINYKIDNFNGRMLKVINGEFKNLRERIYHIVEDVFKESEKYIIEYMKTQEDKLAGELVRMRETLKKQHTKIEAMKEEITKPNWRKAAGEIIASELEHRIDLMTKQSAALEIGRWELGDLVGYRIKDLEKELKEVVRLRRDAA